MVDYLLIVLIIIVLIIDNPFNNTDVVSLFYKLLKYSIVIIGAVHLFGLVDGLSKINKGMVSGVLLIGLTYIYTLATEHTGIEDKVARKLFKLLSWLLLWVILGIHFYIIS